MPDMTIHGSLSSVHCCLDLEHYRLIRGLLENNLGEPVEEFLRPYNLQDPSTYVSNHTQSEQLTSVCDTLTNRCLVALQTVLSGDVYTNLSFLVDMMDVSLELLDSPKASNQKLSLSR